MFLRALRSLLKLIAQLLQLRLLRRRQPGQLRSRSSSARARRQELARARPTLALSSRMPLAFPASRRATATSSSTSARSFLCLATTFCTRASCSAAARCRNILRYARGTFSGVNWSLVVSGGRMSSV